MEYGIKIWPHRLIHDITNLVLHLHFRIQFFIRNINVYITYYQSEVYSNDLNAQMILDTQQVKKMLRFPECIFNSSWNHRGQAHFGSELYATIYIERGTTLT